MRAKKPGDAPPKNFVFDVAFSPDGTSLAASCLDGSVSVFDVAARRRTATLEGHFLPVRCVRWTPDSRMILTACDDCRVLCFDPHRQAQYVDEYTAHTSWVLGVAPAPDGKHFASCSADRTVKIWDMAGPTKGEVAAVLEQGHYDQIWACAYSPDGTKLVSVADDATMQVHELQAQKEPLPEELQKFVMPDELRERCWRNALDPNFGKGLPPKTTRPAAAGGPQRTGGDEAADARAATTGGDAGSSAGGGKDEAAAAAGPPQDASSFGASDGGDSVAVAPAAPAAAGTTTAVSSSTPEDEGPAALAVSTHATAADEAHAAEVVPEGTTGGPATSSAATPMDVDDAPESSSQGAVPPPE